jgi:hypothetical protein
VGVDGVPVGLLVQAGPRRRARRRHREWEFGADLVFGGPGKDQIVAGFDPDDPGDDVLFGDGSGDDVVAFAAAGDDRLDGGPGNDTIQGGQGNDLRGSDGNWVIRMKMEDLGSKRDF